MPLNAFKKTSWAASAESAVSPSMLENQVENGTVVVSDQPVESRFRTSLQFGDKVGFISAPREGAGPIGHGVPFFALAEPGCGEPACSGWERIPTSVRSEY